MCGLTYPSVFFFFFFQAEDGIRDLIVTGVQTCALPISAGVGLEDRQDILGHKSGRITTHYSAPEIGSLVAAVNRIADSRGIHARTVLREIGRASCRGRG